MRHNQIYHENELLSGRIPASTHIHLHVRRPKTPQKVWSSAVFEGQTYDERGQKRSQRILFSGVFRPRGAKTTRIRPLAPNLEPVVLAAPFDSFGHALNTDKGGTGELCSRRVRDHKRRSEENSILCRFSRSAISDTD